MGDFAADGTVVHSTDLNKILKVSEVDTITGTTGTSGASSGNLVKWRSIVGNTDTNGDITVTYASAFPNGAGPVQVTWGYGGTLAYTVAVTTGTVSKTGCKVRVNTAAGAAVTSTANLPIFVTATGW